MAYTLKFYVINQSDSDLILCYSNSKSDREFADRIINEWKNQGLKGDEKSYPEIEGYSRSSSFIVIFSDDFFKSNGQVMLDQRRVHQIHKIPVGAANYQPDISVIPIMRMSEGKIEENYRPSFNRWNSIDSCTSPSYIAKLILTRFTVKFYVINQSDLDLILCYSNSKSDREFADRIINEWKSQGFEGHKKSNLGIVGYSRSSSLKYSIDKFFVIIFSEEFFKSNGQIILDQHIVHQRREAPLDTANYEPGISVIPILRMSEKKIEENHRPSLNGWNPIKSYTGPNNIAKLILHAYYKFNKDLNKQDTESWANILEKFYQEYVDKALGKRMEYDVFAIYFDEEPLDWMLECISILKGPEFRLKVRHKEADSVSSCKTNFPRDSLTKSSKILVFISPAFYKNINLWNNNYRIHITKLKKKEDVICVVCDNTKPSKLPEYLQECTRIKIDSLCYENLYSKLIPKPKPSDHN